MKIALKLRKTKSLPIKLKHTQHQLQISKIEDWILSLVSQSQKKISQVLSIDLIMYYFIFQSC